MKKRAASGARGYLSQMAEPVLAGEPTLRVRHRGHGWDAQNMSAVPQEIVETHRPTPSHAMPGEDNRSVKRDAPGLIDAHGLMGTPGLMDAGERIDHQRQINSEAGIDTVRGGIAPQQELQGYENIVSQNASRPLSAQAQKKLDPIGKLAVENSGEEPGLSQRFRPVISHNANPIEHADDTDASNPVKFERRDVVQEQNLTPEATDAAFHSRTILREKNIREQRSEEHSERQPTLLSETHSTTKVRAKNPMEAIAESPEPKPILNPNQQQQKSGTSIHIGTIEVRTVVHRPEPAAPVASPATMSQPPAPPAGPLARSLNWRYGLVQG